MNKPKPRRGVAALFTRVRGRNCLKSRSVVSQAQKSMSYRSEVSPLFALFRRLQRVRFEAGQTSWTVSRKGFLGTLYLGYCIERRRNATKSSLLGASAPGKGFLQLVVLYRDARS
jgi:hypothetical protein